METTTQTHTTKHMWRDHTLKRDPIEENFEDFEDSSDGGNKLDTKEQEEAFSRD